MTRPAKRSRMTKTLLFLPDEVLSQILNNLLPKEAFDLAQTNTRLLQIFQTSFQTIDTTTPFKTNTGYNSANLAVLLRHAKSLTTLKTDGPLCLLRTPPVKVLHFDDSVTLFVDPLTRFTSLKELVIDHPETTSPRRYAPLIGRLDKLGITNVDNETMLPDIEHLLKRYGQGLKNLTLTISHHLDRSLDDIDDFLQLLTTIKTLPNLEDLSFGIGKPAKISRMYDKHNKNTFRHNLDHLMSMNSSRPTTERGKLTKVHLFTAGFDPGAVVAILPLCENADLHLSFSGNTLIMQKDGACVLQQLASIPSMYKLPYVPFLRIGITEFNLVLREMGTDYTLEDKGHLARLITNNLQVLRIQIPFRSTRNLTPIARNITAIMQLGAVEQLHITREIAQFTQEGCIKDLFKAFKNLKRLYLTAPENYPQDPDPERRCSKYSAWLFIDKLPSFLQRLPEICPRLEVLLLEEIGIMGDVDNPTAMTGVIERSLMAVDEFEHKLLGVDASTIRQQLLLWRSQYLRPPAKTAWIGMFGRGWTLPSL